MMSYKKLLSLKGYNTFSIDAKSLYSFFCYKEDELIDFLKSSIVKKKQYYILGGGSNVLFTKDYEGVIIFMQNKGIEILEKEGNDVFIKVSAGENWDDFVKFCTDNDFGGVENLSLIPGNVGATPVQNIGAYGVELKDVLWELEALNRQTLKKEIFKNEDCKFSYRESVFKKELKDKYIILNVTFKLSKSHNLKLDYGTIKNVLKTNSPTISEIRNAIIEIRESKLPNPEEFPNAGSFFKNPIVSKGFFEDLKIKFPNLVSYLAGENKIKLAAGQLIDLCNWKGKKENGVGVHEKQALVIVNYENANGNEILNFSKKIQKSVFDKFGVEIEREVTII